MKPSNCDIETRWQGIVYVYDCRQERLPWVIRLLRQGMETLLRCAEAIVGRV